MVECVENDKKIVHPTFLNVLLKWVLIVSPISVFWGAGESRGTIDGLLDWLQIAGLGLLLTAPYVFVLVFILYFRGVEKAHKKQKDIFLSKGFEALEMNFYVNREKQKFMLVANKSHIFFDYTDVLKWRQSGSLIQLDIDDYDTPVRDVYCANERSATDVFAKLSILLK